MGDSQDGPNVVQKLIGGLTAARVDGRSGLTKVLAAAVARFQLIATIDEYWEIDMAAGRLAYDETTHEEISALFRLWLDGAEQLERERAGMPLADADRVLAERFAVRLQEARGICTPDEIFFAGPELEALADRAIEAYRAGETVEFDLMGEWTSRSAGPGEDEAGKDARRPLDEAAVATLVAQLEAVRARPAMFFGAVAVEPAEHWLHGFEAAVSALFRYDDFKKHREQVLTAREWTWSADLPSTQMVERGLSPAAVVDELLAIESAVLRLASARPIEPGDDAS